MLMMRDRLTTPKYSSYFFCFLLAYSLILSMVAPFAVRKAKAASDTSKAAAPSKATKSQKKKVGRRDAQVLVRFRNDASLQDKQAFVSALGAKSARRLRGSSFAYLIYLAEGQSPEAAAAQLLLNPVIQMAEPNYLISRDEVTPNNPRKPEKSELLNTGREVGQPSTVTTIRPAQTSTGATGAVIAVIDGGIDFTHPDLSTYQWKNSRESANARDDDKNGFIDDVNGFNWITYRKDEQEEDLTHGTQVAGIIASQWTNAAGTPATPSQLNLMSLRVLDNNGMGDIASAVEAIDYAAMMGASVINCSWGTDENSAFLRDAIERAGKRDVLVIASAGNDGRDIDQAPYYPASYGLSNVLVVAATNNSNELVSWSNTGIERVHVAAPGDNISSTGRNGSYKPITGTSASAALASGVAGLIKVRRPYLSAERTREMILVGAKPIAALKDKVSSGSVIDAAEAVAQVNSLPPNEGKERNPATDNNPGNGGNGQGAPNNPGNGNGGGNRNDNGNPPVTAPSPTKGAPSPGLPNLDLIRNKKSDDPKAKPAVPSERCPLQNPDCDKKGKDKAGASLRQPDLQQDGNISASATKTDGLNGTVDFFAWNSSSIPEVADLFNPQQRAVSDSAPAFNLPSLIRNSAARNFSYAPMPQSSTPINLALGRIVTQSTDPGWGGQPGKAVDGNTSGLWSNNSVTHTNYDAQAWWQVDLGSSQTIDNIKVWNRTDCCVERLSNFYVFVSDSPFTSTNLTATINQSGVSSYYISGVAPATTTISINRTGRYVRVQLSGTDYLSLAEVEVWGSASGTGGTGNVSSERVAPYNRTGSGGEDLVSRNYNWSIPIVGLNGRAGLDLGLSLAYNSLVWTKAGSTIVFDADHGFPSPGFRLGFPVIQSKYLNAQGVYSYLMITSNGGRVELGQVGSSNIYEAADSSYLQLIDYTSSLLVRTKDGTQLSYILSGSDYQCTEIKDRNGNRIVATYNSGQITSVTDTLNRTLTFNYDGYQNLSTITQSWRRDSPTGQVVETHTWASFGWSNLTIQTSFSGLTLSGVQNGQSIPVLTQVSLDDGSRYNYEYTTWGQVAKISNYRADNILRNYVSYNLDTSAGQTDCPRFTQRRDYAREWNNDTEAITIYSAFNPGAGVADVTMPDGTSYREYFNTSGWQNGLTYQSEFWSGGQLKKWTTTSWTQDNTGVSYQLNPRPYDLRIYDEAGNQRRTTIDYTSYGLPSNVREYAPDGVTVLRRAETQYRPDTEFISRHILNVVWMELVYDGESTLRSKLNFHHDRTPFYNGQAPSVGHDTANYNTGFFGRANITGILRYNVNAPNDDTQAVWIKQITYNYAGEPVLVRDALDHSVQISYADSYSDGNNTRNTLAYPTTITDGDNYSSTIQYNYDMGVPVRTQDPKGAVQTSAYDGAGRTQKVVNQFNGAYTEWVYPAGGEIVNYSTIVSGAPAAMTVTYLDGAGHLRARGGDLPDSIGHYYGQFWLYDIMGRVSQYSANPTEISGTWSAAGDDAAGWLWTYQQYDWKGRPTVTTNPDGTTSQASYTGCGCAGGEVVTLTGEAVTQGNRRQKIYHDVLGRVVKTEVLNWDQSIYSTVVTSYNALDQVTNARQYAGVEGSGTYQETVMTYDGFGRLYTQKAPAQTSPTNYSYNADDTLQTVTDARGASATFSYNARHLVTGISYSAPSGITGTSAVSYGYDAAGNRTGMTDGSGNTTYQYNTISQLETETRSFNGLSGSFALSYTYNLAGQLQSVTDPFSSTINYGYDQVGRLNNITGTSFGGVTQYASNMKYRAWGALKHLNYGSTGSRDITYNNRLLPASYTVSGVMQKSYQYNNDGSLRYSQDISNGFYDRAYTYDHMGRLTAGLSGIEARGGQSQSWHDSPYNETFSYDAMGHLTGRATRDWNRNYSMGDVYQNDRATNWGYDADGRVLNNPDAWYAYDAAGHTITVGMDSTTTQTFDGDGQSVKTVESVFNEQTWTYDNTTKLYVRSSVLGGQVISEMDEQGHKLSSYVYGGGSVFARQFKGVAPYSNDYVSFEHRDPSNASLRTTDAYGNIISQEEYDPIGANANLGPTLYNVPPPDEGGGSLLDYGEGGMPSFLRTTYILDGMPVSADMALQALHSGAAVQCPNNDCGPRLITVTGYGRYGQVVGSSSRLVSYGQAGWDGSLDGRYRVIGSGTLGFSQIASNIGGFLGSLTSTDARGIGEFGGAAFQRVSGSGGSWTDLAHGNSELNKREFERDLKGWRLNLFMKGYEVALALLSNPDCQRAVAGDSGIDPAGALQFLLDKNKIKYGGYNSSLVGRAIVPDAPDMFGGRSNLIRGKIRFFDSFFEKNVAGNVGTWGSSDPSKPELIMTPAMARAYEILHELRHLIKDEWHDETGTSRKLFMNEILRGCFGY